MATGASIWRASFPEGEMNAPYFLRKRRDRFFIIRRKCRVIIDRISTGSCTRSASRAVSGSVQVSRYKDVTHGFCRCFAIHDRTYRNEAGGRESPQRSRGCLPRLGSARQKMGRGAMRFFQLCRYRLLAVFFQIISFSCNDSPGSLKMRM